MCSAPGSAWSRRSDYQCCSWAYDAAGRLSSATSNFGSFGYLYDAASNPAIQSYGDGFVAGYAYDALHRVSSAAYTLAGGSGLSTAATVAYDPLSRRTGVTFADGSSESYTYDTADRVKTIAHVFPSSTSSDVANTYVYDAAGRDVTRLTDNVAYRAPPTLGTTSYGAVNGLNQYPSVNGAGYGWWAEGPLETDGVLTHYYDELGAQASAVQGASSLSWVRDATGQAVYFGKAGASGTLTEALAYDGSRPEAVIERASVTPPGGSSPTVSGDRISLLGPEPDERLMYVDTDGSVYFPHADRQGSTIALSKGGSAATQWRYGAYGESPDAVTLPASPSDPSSYAWRYTGQRYDSDFGLQDDKARTYSPALGRFLQPDPAGVEMGPHLYAYVGNDPLGGEDPSGMLPNCPGGCVAAGTSSVEGVEGLDADNLNASQGQDQTGTGATTTSAPSGSFQTARADPPPESEPTEDARDEIGRQDDSTTSESRTQGVPDPNDPFAITSKQENENDRTNFLNRRYPDIQEKIKAANAPDRNGLTQAGRALQKHGDRLGSVFPQVGPRPSVLNAAGSQIVEEIFSNPHSTITPNRFGGLDIQEPNGRGARYDGNNNSMGFLEP